MDWALITKIVLAAAAIFTASKVLFDIFYGKRSNIRDEYSFSKKFFDDLENGKLHPYVVEKGYQAIAGTTNVKASEVAYILSLKNPVQCLRDFVLSKDLFERLETNGSFKLVFKRKYKSKFSRSWRMAMYFVLYFVFAFLAFAPFVISTVTKSSFSTYIVQLAITFPVFGSYAWFALKSYGQLKRGEYLFNNQSQHTSKVIVDNLKARSEAA